MNKNELVSYESTSQAGRLCEPEKTEREESSCMFVIVHVIPRDEGIPIVV